MVARSVASSGSCAPPPPVKQGSGCPPLPPLACPQAEVPVFVHTANSLAQDLWDLVDAADALLGGTPLW